MKIHVLTADITNKAFLRWGAAIIANGHSFEEDITKADLVIIGPDIKAKFDFIGALDRKIESYITYNNWLARTFEAY